MTDDLVSPILGAVAAITTVVAAYLQWRSHENQRKVDRLELQLASKEECLVEKDRTIQELKDFVSKITYSETIDHNVVVIGPRSSGKTSLVKSLTEIWRDIHGMQPTASFDRFEYKFPNRRRKSQGRKFMGMELGVYVQARFVLWDYGGEDHLLSEALKKIAGFSGDCVLLLVLTSEEDRTLKNNEYFSYSFLQHLQATLAAFVVRNIKVFVVFTKADLARIENANLQHLLKANELSIKYISSFFGTTAHYHIVSANSGNGLGPFVRQLASCAVDEAGLPKVN